MVNVSVEQGLVGTCTGYTRVIWYSGGIEAGLYVGSMWRNGRALDLDREGLGFDPRTTRLVFFTLGVVLHRHCYLAEWDEEAHVGCGLSHLALNSVVSWQ